MWITFVGVTLLGFTEKEVGHFTFLKWNQLYEYYKRFYNFKTNKYLFKIDLNSEELEESYEWFKD